MCAGAGQTGFWYCRRRTQLGVVKKTGALRRRGLKRGHVDSKRLVSFPFKSARFQTRLLESVRSVQARKVRL